MFYYYLEQQLDSQKILSLRTEIHVFLKAMRFPPSHCRYCSTGSNGSVLCLTIALASQIVILTLHVWNCSLQ